MKSIFIFVILVGMIILAILVALILLATIGTGDRLDGNLQPLSERIVAMALRF